MTKNQVIKVNKLVNSPEVPTPQQPKLVDQKRIRKKCVGCLDNFTCSQSQNYDYCSSCSLNGNRYLTKGNKCPECDGSGLIKFPNQPPRSCKLCYLARQETKFDKFFTK